MIEKLPQVVSVVVYLLLLLLAWMAPGCIEIRRGGRVHRLDVSVALAGLTVLLGTCLAAGGFWK